MDDNTAIALAALHGCEFFSILGDWWVDNTSPPLHPLEKKMSDEIDKFHGWESQAALARDYLKFYNLGE